MKPLRVLQVVTVMNRGGLETMLMNYYRHIDRDKIQFDFMVHRQEEGHYDQEIIKLGGKIYKMPQIKPGNYKSYFIKLDDFFQVHPYYKIVHSHINENSSFVLRAAKKAGIPCRIAHSHLSDLGIDYKLPFRLYARYEMRDHPSDYFACSKNAGKWLFGRNKKLNLERVTILNNAVNTQEFTYDPKKRLKLRKDLGIREEQLVVGHIGRFNKQKNHIFLIEIFKEILTLNGDAILLLAGDGYLKTKVEKKVKEMGLIDQVKFIGVRSDIPNLLQAMDIFLFPSLFEGLPVVLVEAQAAGLRCVVSDSITKECDLTDRIEFMSLNSPPLTWAKKILSLSYEHLDTSNMLRNRGYDTFTMSKWLTKYYFDHAL
ncbi:glycosyltransferase family 1 protein [Falsibacillus pallidus]|uniref:Glycosyltransferase involved in cell wall biosynthesis n=1 Tax=Falsibacillus pallidus TaxID=493781 RepID=A0A370GPU5_9BACI|nr:glycosyltransferase family 1 protein [Falsibacillus pallidus]RDI45707.1 glycosyltransferase involved in cell wall biosynthesis [Falsibacillus pallidus]